MLIIQNIIVIQKVIWIYTQHKIDHYVFKIIEGTVPLFKHLTNNNHDMKRLWNWKSSQHILKTSIIKVILL